MEFKSIAPIYNLPNFTPESRQLSYSPFSLLFGQVIGSISLSYLSLSFFVYKANIRTSQKNFLSLFHVQIKIGRGFPFCPKKTEMFASNFLRNSFKLVHQYPISRHQLQHSKVYSRVPQTLNRIKTMELKRQLSNSTPCRFFSSSSASSNVGFIGWYLEMLNSRPILTKTITCTLILIAADLSSQVRTLREANPEFKLYSSAFQVLNIELILFLKL